MPATAEGGIDVATVRLHSEGLDGLVEQDGLMFPWALHRRVFRKKSP
jgi:hypothetical protein